MNEDLCTPQNLAMHYFDTGGSCSHFMTDRAARNKIMVFLCEEKNATFFLRTPDVYKIEFVDDFILI